MLAVGIIYDDIHSIFVWVCFHYAAVQLDQRENMFQVTHDMHFQYVDWWGHYKYSSTSRHHKQIFCSID